MRSRCTCSRCASRDRAIRAVAAAQWAVACVLFDRGNYGHTMFSPEMVRHVDASSDTIADLPCAVDVVGE